MIEYDALGLGIRVVLIQEGRPIANTRHSAHLILVYLFMTEMFAIVHAVTKWRPYLIGRCFQIHTNLKSLKYFLEQRISSLEQQKWITKLLGFDYEILYKKGSENLVADAPSHLPEQAELVTIRSYLPNDGTY